METKLIKEEMKEIEMPFEMQERILKNCRNAGLEEKENIYMQKLNKKWIRFATVAAAVALCLGLGSITALAASGKLEGFFVDVKDWNGAVVGTTYEQATEEIEVGVTVDGDSLAVEAVLLKATEAPYVEIDTFGVKAYQITDMSGDVVVEGISTTVTEVVGGKVSIAIPLNGLESGSYKLIIAEFVGDSKADQPLPISGYWECEFEL